MNFVIYAVIVVLGVVGGHDKEVARLATQDCQDLGYSAAVYVEGSGNKYMCQ